MREIKFRAWDRKAKMMRTVDDLKNLWTLCNHGGDAQTIPNVIVVNQLYVGGDLELVVDKDCDIMQYTGLKDKNLWESDIISDHVGIGVVEYVEKYAAFRVNYQNGRCKWFHDYLDSEMESLERIGNIYENPELLESK